MDELDVEVGVWELIEVGAKADSVDTKLDSGVDLMVEKDIGVEETTGAEVGVLVGLETGFTGAAVFSKQVQALDKREAGATARLLGTCWFGALRYLGQKAAASLAKRSKRRRVLSS